MELDIIEESLTILWDVIKPPCLGLGHKCIFLDFNIFIHIYVIHVYIHTHACVPRNTYYLEFALTYFSNGKKKEKPGNRR